MDSSYIFFTLFTLFALFNILKVIDISNSYGKLIIKLARIQGYLIFWVILLIISIWLLIDNYKFYLEHIEYATPYIFLNQIIFILVSLYRICSSFKYSEIREQGIYLDGGFYKWSRVKNYEWISDNIILFYVEEFTKYISEVKVKVIHADREKIDEILQKYVNPSSPTSS